MGSINVPQRRSSSIFSAVCLVVCPSSCVLFFLSLTQRLCDPPPTPRATPTLCSHRWLTRSLPLSSHPSPTCCLRTVLPPSLITSPSFHAASMSKRSTAHCMECATVRRLYGAVCSRLHGNLFDSARCWGGGRGLSLPSLCFSRICSSRLLFCWKNGFERGGRMTYYCNCVLVIQLDWVFSMTLNNHSTSTRS